MYPLFARYAADTDTLFTLLEYCLRISLLYSEIYVNQEHVVYLSRSDSETFADPEEGQGVQTPPLENFKNIAFLSNTGPDPLKITKLPIQISM